MSEEGFTVAGRSMPEITIGYGAFLILWGIVVSLVSGSESITSYIPSMMGAPILIAGLLAHKQPERRKLWMHVAVVFGLLCFLGGGRVFSGSELNYATASQGMLLVTGAVYTFLCVKSFIHARKQAEATEA